MIDNQPSASGSRNPRVTARRILPSRRDAAPRAPKLDVSRWKVQLELAPAEIALVYRQGLARGAEVCRRGTHEWRPLVTTPELRAALEGRASWPDIESGPSSSAAISLTQSLAIGDPGLAKLLLAPRALPSFGAAPPPPPIVHVEPMLELPPPARPRIDSVPDSAVTQPFPRPLPLPVLAPLRSEPPPAASYTVTAAHARPTELSFVAALSVAATLVAAVIAQRASHWGEARAKIEPAAAVARARPTLAPAPVQASPTPLSVPASSIPVINMGALPVERTGLGLLSSAVSVGSTSSRARSRSSSNGDGGPDRASFARALAGAARAAQGCGEGPVHTQVIATFGPSGVPRSVQFAGAPPPAALRSCVLSAVARARVTPFSGDPVTVSKSLSW